MPSSPMLPDSRLSLSPSDGMRRAGAIHIGLLLLLLVNLGCLVCYLFLTYQLEFNADSAVANLLAQEILETRDYLPDDWNWVNRDIWIVFMQTWIVPLLLVAPNGYAVHAIGGLIGCVLIFAATLAVLSIVDASRRARLFALAVLFAGFSPYMSEHIFGQQAYGTIYFVGCFMLYGAWTCVHSSGRRQLFSAAFVVILCILMAWANPQRAAIYFVLPVIGALLALQGNLSRSTAVMPPARKPALLIVLLVLALGVGALLHKYSLAASFSLDGRLAVNWLSYDGMLTNASRALQGVLACLGGMPSAGQPVLSLRGVADALRLLSAAAVLILVPSTILRLLVTQSRGLSFFSAATITCIAANLFIYVTTTVPQAGNPELTVRYLVPGLLWAVLLVVVVAVDKIEFGVLYRLAAVPALAVLALSAPIAYGIVLLPHYQSEGGIAKATQSTRLAAFLEQQGLQYGYATFWNAGQITVLSNGKVKVRQIEFHEKLPVPMRHLSSNRWYRPAAWQGPTFLLLTKEETALADWAKLEALSGKPTRRLSFENFELAVFDHNLAGDFATWQLHVDEPRRYPVSAYTPHVIGRYSPEGSRLTAEAGEVGTLHFGPYQRLAGGDLLVSFDLVTEGENVREFGHVDVVANAGQRELGKRTIDRTGEHRITVPIRFEGIVPDLEFRVMSNGAGKISLSNIEIRRNDKR